MAQIASRLLGRLITAAAPVPAVALDPFIAPVYGEYFALMREAWTTERFWRRR